MKKIATLLLLLALSSPQALADGNTGSPGGRKAEPTCQQDCLIVTNTVTTGDVQVDAEEGATDEETDSYLDWLLDIIW